MLKLTVLFVFLLSGVTLTNYLIGSKDLTKAPGDRPAASAQQSGWDEDKIQTIQASPESVD